MINTLFQHGVRKFRVNNIGGWPLAVYDAINSEAGKLSAAERAKVSVSVYVPSQYFADQFDIQIAKDHVASWSSIPHWIIQLDACNPIDGQCANPTEDGLSKTDMADYIAQIGKAVPVDAFPHVRFTLEKTEYPFWAGSTNTNFPFDSAHTFDQFAKSKGFAGAYFAESGWPRFCATKPATATPENQCAYLKSLLQGTFPDQKFVAYWWLMGAEDVGDGCGADSWGLFKADAMLACPGSF